MPDPNPAIANVLEKLHHSAFRKKFYLTAEDKAYLYQKGQSVIVQHAHDFIVKRLADAYPARDGKQTPWKGHPVFIAQHATASCCRSCLQKWHHIPKGQSLTEAQVTYIENLILAWLGRELKR